tara:strand:- start:6614 stop:6730 length:117 start_codon:yes stop_codon:yes gene_type:complete
MYGKRSRYRKIGIYMYSKDELKILAVTSALIITIAVII